MKIKNKNPGNRSLLKLIMDVNQNEEIAYLIGKSQNFPYKSKYQYKFSTIFTPNISTEVII